MYQKMAETNEIRPGGDIPEREPPFLVRHSISDSVEMVDIDLLLPGDSPRIAGVDPDHVRVLAEYSGELPPILVDRATNRVIDGMHRLRCAQLKGERKIAVRYFDGGAELAFLVAVEANTAHGLPLTLADRRAAAARILVSYPQLSNRAIAATTGLAAKTVAAIRRELPEDIARQEFRVGKDGRLRPLNTADGRRSAAQLIAEHPTRPLSEIAKAAGVSVGTVRDVRQRVQNGEDPLPLRLRNGDAGKAKKTSTGSSRRRESRQAVDTSAVLANLRRDPSLRYNETGREFVRWLERYLLPAGAWRWVIRAVPPHCRTVVSKVARRCSAEWSDLADELDRSR